MWLPILVIDTFPASKLDTVVPENMAEGVDSNQEKLKMAVPEREELLNRLDSLWEQYLELLDQYQKVQAQISAHFSSGFLSLAQANFNNSSGTRYGQDYYDERMQASRTVTMVSGLPVPSVAICIPEPQTSSQDSTSSSSESKDSNGISERATGLANSSSKKEPTSSTPKHKSVDPLRWYGLLVPPALRSAQASFIQAVEGPIPRLVTLSKELRSLEIDIGRTRKQIRKM
ncbi:hypothetical protein K432DRAFT_403444 [Lepidopterella palustris CBS 459.81]|uniref:Vacuolar ATPase assembly protein VMA22 n=1 Tax=Lepidopterella palustris CBS 459.81 TaxID=1314670 RepID=A0A8E2ED77_9PEZI|nr:hypothetical protein K432DRAFT_403444 [Lepidopterella palustris CBS 459.81]